MRGLGREGTVLQPAHLSDAGEALRHRLARRQLLIALLLALVFHAAVLTGFWLVDLLRVRDLGEWSGPVLVKIGAPEAPESPAPDPGPAPEPLAPPAEEIPVPESPAETAPAPQAPPVPSPTEQPNPTTAADSASDSGRPADDTAPTQETMAPPDPTPAAPAPARVRGSEDGNNYVVDFEGREDEVGRAGAYEFITSYMPLPEVLDGAIVTGAREYLRMSPAFIRAEIERYWEPLQGNYVKKPHPRGSIPMPDRPYYWSLLINSLGYDTADADWKISGMRPVVVEFSVNPSQGARGAELSDIEMVSRTNNPRVDDAVIYGLSRWVYYNDSSRVIRGRITYNFGR